MSMQYHRVETENQKASYTEFDVVDFVLTCQERSFLGNSFRITADLRVQEASADIVNQVISLPATIGAHSLIESIVIETQNQGVVERLSNYGRMCRMETDGVMNQDDTFNSHNICEMRCADTRLSQVQLRGCYSAPDVSGNANRASTDNDFSLKPNCCLNRVESSTGSVAFPYRRTGNIRVSVRLARIYNALWGAGVTANTSYSLSNMRMHFVSVDDTGDNSVVMRTRLDIKASISSNNTNVSVKVPAVASGMSASFLLQSQEGAATTDSTACQEPPSVSRVQFLFNDSTNKYITYELKSREDVLDRYLDSWGSNGSNAMTLENLKANTSYGIGLNFNDFVDLSNQKFGLQVDSAIASGGAMVVYLYFHSIYRMG